MTADELHLHYTQDTRRLSLQPPLGENVLLIRSIDGSEVISQLYNYRIEAMAELSADVDFSKLLGQTVVVAVTLSHGADRYIHGMVHRVARGESSTSATAYGLEIGPPIWPLTKRVQSRIFQQLSVPDILKKVLAGIDCQYQIVGTFGPREYCEQYHESDFQFFSRFWEDEGIYYFFLHEESGCKLVLANTSQSHPSLPHMPSMPYHPQSNVDSEVISAREKVQTLRSGKVTLWDHHHQLPGKNLEVSQTVQPSVSVGSETKKLNVACADLEQYHFPGGCTGRFDGIGKCSGEQASALQKIFQDILRPVGIRMQPSLRRTKNDDNSNFTNQAI